MQRKFLAFDIETAAILTDEQMQNWRAHRPLGMICAAAQASDAAAPRTWDSRDPGADDSGRMTRTQVVDFLSYLQQMREAGYALLSWNGLSFDWDVIAEESGAIEACRELALEHVDPMFHVFCDRGFPVGLSRAAEGCRIPGKPAGMSGMLAPRKWIAGQYDEVLEYVAHDVRILLEVTTCCERAGSFRWMTQKGRVSSMPLPRGWLTVREALRMPQPDTSWMTSPLPRQSFTEWLGDALDDCLGAASAS